MANEIQAQPNRRWGEVFKKMARYQVTKRDSEAAEKSIGAWVVALTFAASFAGAYAYKASSIYFGAAGAVALIFAYFLYIWHRRQNKRLICWPLTLPMISIHLIAVVLGVASLGKVIVRPHAPSLLTLWATDFIEHGVYNELGHSNFPSDQQQRVRYFYKLVQNLDQQTKFLTIYIPETPDIQQIAAHVAGFLPEYLTPNDYVSGKAVGEAYPVDNLHLRFTGVVFIYHEGALAPEELSRIRAIFKRSGAAAQFRGLDYAETVGQGVLNGSLHQPPDYEIQNGIPCRVTPRKPPGAVRNGDHMRVPQGEDFTDGALVGIPYMCKPK